MCVCKQMQTFAFLVVLQKGFMLSEWEIFGVTCGNLDKLEKLSSVPLVTDNQWLGVSVCGLCQS